MQTPILVDVNKKKIALTKIIDKHVESSCHLFYPKGTEASSTISGNRPLCHPFSTSDKISLLQLIKQRESGWRGGRGGGKKQRHFDKQEGRVEIERKFGEHSEMEEK